MADESLTNCANNGDDIIKPDQNTLKFVKLSFIRVHMDEAKLDLRIARGTLAAYERHVKELRAQLSETQRSLKYTRKQVDEARVDTAKALSVVDALCKQPPAEDVFTWLPAELLFIICSYLGYADRMAFASCSKHTRLTRVTNIERLAFIKTDVRALFIPGSGPKRRWECNTKKGLLILAGLQARYPGTPAFSTATAYDCDDVRAYVNVNRSHTKLVWGEKEVRTDGVLLSMKKHPVLPIIVALKFLSKKYFYLMVWDGHQKWEKFVGNVLAPLRVEGNAVRFYSDDTQYIL